MTINKKRSSHAQIYLMKHKYEQQYAAAILIFNKQEIHRRKKQ